MSLFERDVIDDILDALRELGVKPEALNVSDFVNIIEMSERVCFRLSSLRETDVRDWHAVELYSRAKEKHDGEQKKRHG